MKYLKICIALSVIALSSAASLDLHPLSEENIALINQKAKTWKAGRNFEVKDWERVKGMVAGVLPYDGPRKLEKAKPHPPNIAAPNSFDARQKYPQCKSVQTIWDQSRCGSCWAIAATAAMSDRICIQSNQVNQTFVSAEDLLSCCPFCGDGCYGGYHEMAWQYWTQSGIVTGGLYQANQGCKDYTLQPCEHHVNSITLPQCRSLKYDTPQCVKSCSDSSLDYEGSLTFGQTPYSFNEEREIQVEIWKNGPVEASFSVMDDFPSYKSGVYQTTSHNVLGSHAVKVLGWGVEDDTPYWLVANSWNSGWGDNGYFKILRGENHLGIETNVVAAAPLF